MKDATIIVTLVFFIVGLGAAVQAQFFYWPPLPGFYPFWQPDRCQQAAKRPEATDEQPAAPESGLAEPEAAAEAGKEATPPERAIAKLVNEHRKQSGLTALRISSRLCGECAEYSRQMSERSTLLHAPEMEGRECLGVNFETPEEVVEAWKANKELEAVLLGNWKRIGVGVFGKYYTLRVEE
jgi:uncharacterized protein YkwD